jgi:hypothetical protein
MRVDPVEAAEQPASGPSCPRRIGYYRHLLDLQLPEQQSLFFEQLENLGLQLKQPLVLNWHVDVLQDRDPPAKPRL